MKEAMSASDKSYYKSKQPLGSDGDFITAPEISQMFGEMIAIWVLSSWEKLGRPNLFNLVELGPGRGILMRDLLRGSIKQTAFQQSIRLNLLDINPILIEEQKKNLAGYDVNWINKIEDLAPLPSIFIANEFFDALPVRQYIKKGDHWEEVMIGDKQVTSSPRAPLPSSPRRRGSINIIKIDSHLRGDNMNEHKNATQNAILEESPESLLIMESISRHIKANQGAALIIDYGYDIAPNNRTKDQYNSTLQAVKDHKFHPVFEDLGEADLSCHVDFYALKNIALKQELRVIGAMTQASLLKELGIDVRLKMLIDQNQELAKILQHQYHRLMSKDEMGELFKAIIIES